LISAGFLLSRKCLRDNDLELFYYFRDLVILTDLEAQNELKNKLEKNKQSRVFVCKLLIPKELSKEKKKVIK